MIAREERLQWIIKRLTLKHPNYSAIVVKRIAETLLQAEDVDNEHEDEFEFNRRVEHERNLDAQSEKQSETEQVAIQKEEQTAYKAIQHKRIEALQRHPLYRKLFNGNKPPNTINHDAFVGINKRDKLGRTKLHDAAYEGDLNECRRLVEVEAIQLDVKDNRHNTAFQIAVREGHTTLADYLRTAKQRAVKQAPTSPQP